MRQTSIDLTTTDQENVICEFASTHYGTGFFLTVPRSASHPRPILASSPLERSISKARRQCLLSYVQISSLGFLISLGTYRVQRSQSQQPFLRPHCHQQQRSCLPQNSAHSARNRPGLCPAAARHSSSSRPDISLTSRTTTTTHPTPLPLALACRPHSHSDPFNLSSLWKSSSALPAKADPSPVESEALRPKPRVLHLRTWIAPVPHPLPSHQPSSPSHASLLRPPPLKFSLVPSTPSSMPPSK